MGMESVIVVGGGVVGASVAYHLQRRGASVRLFERADTLGAGTTARSSLGFRQYGTTDAQIRLKRYGKRQYNEFLVEGGLRYLPTEAVHLATTAEGRAVLEARAEAEHPAGSPSELLDGADVTSVVMLPGVDDGLTGALYRPNAGFFTSSEAVVSAFADRASDLGADIRTGVAVTDVLVRDGRVGGVVADGETHDADAVVAAAGPWNRKLAAGVGLDLPVRQQRMHVLELAPDRRVGRPLPKVRHVESGATFRGRPDGSILAYHSAPAEDKYAASEAIDPDERHEVSAAVVDRVLDALETVLPGVGGATVTDVGVAFPSRTPDANPVVGWTSVPGFILAATHSRGVQYAPGIGDVVARQVVDGDPTDLYRDLSITRFDGYTDTVSG